MVMRMRRLLCFVLAAVTAVCCVPFSAYALPASDGADISYEAAREAMVLLKNDNTALADINGNGKLDIEDAQVLMSRVILSSLLKIS